MPRILGIDIPPHKRVDIALRAIYGVGPVISKLVLENAKVDPAVRAKDLDEQQISKIVHALQETQIRDEKLMLECDLRRELGQHLKRLKGIKCYRGLRHLRGLPVRGQRTQTNARTRKGPRSTVGVQRKADVKS